MRPIPQRAHRQPTVDCYKPHTPIDMPVGFPNRFMKADGLQARGTARHSEGAAKTNHVDPALAGTVDASVH